QIRGDSRVDELDLAGLALEGGIQAPAEHTQVARVQRAADLQLAGELGEEAVAVSQLVDQRATLVDYLTDLPLAARIEQAQLAAVPLPFTGQPFQQAALPALATVARRLADPLVGLQVQA